MSTSDEKTFAPIRTPRVSEEVSARIRAAIFAGKFAFGDRLPSERQLAEQFGISRVAVREGMRNLEMSGLIVLRKGRSGGAFVTGGGIGPVTQSLRDMLDLGQASFPMLLEARAHLMDQVVRLAAMRATEEDFTALEQNLRQMQELTEAGKIERRTLTAIEFNKLLAAATRNAILCAFVDAIGEVVRRVVAVAPPEPLANVLSMRKRLIAQLRGKDQQGAATTMQIYLDDLHEHLLQSLNRATAKPRPRAPRADR